jgi:hypothetical protein
MPAKGKTPLDHLQAETAPRVPDGPVEVELAGRTLQVMPVKKWRASGLRALRENDIDLWAEKCLAPGSYAVWQDIDPDLEQCEEFFATWTEVSGESRPK